MFEELTEQVKNISSPFLEQLSAELVDLKMRRQGRGIVIEILADKPTGGITMGECAVLNRNIVQKIETDHILSEEYSVEVSSPGMDRPLKSVKDFLRAVGRPARVHLLEPLEGKIEHEGIVREVLREQVIINKEEHSIAIPIEKIALARQVIHLR